MEFLDYLFLGTLGIILTFGIFGGFTKWGFEAYGEPDPECQHIEDDENSPDCTCNSGLREKYFINWKRVLIALMILGFEICLLSLAHAPYNQY